MGPYIKNKRNAQSIIINSIIALIPIIFFGVIKIGLLPYSNGNKNELFSPIIPIVVSLFSCLTFDTLYSFIIEKKKNLKRIILENKSIYLSLLLAFSIPMKTSIFLIICVSFLYSTLKIIFKKFEKIRINEVALSAFLLIILLSAIGQYSATNQLIGTYDELVKPFGSISKMIVGMHCDTLGQVSSLLCVISFLFLILTNSIKWKISVSYLLSIFGVLYVIGGINSLGFWYPFYQIIAGGLVFTGIFVASLDDSTPVTPIGQILFGLFAGILTIVFTYLLQFNVGGAFLSILIMNLLTSLLDKIGAYARFNFKITIIPFIIAWILIFVLSLLLSIKY